MNIFFSDTCPVKAANYLRNPRRITKMCLESAQMLFTAIIKLKLLDFNEVEFSDLSTKKLKKSYYIGKDKIYAPTHANHPSNKWVRESRENFLWLLDHFIRLCERYKEQSGKEHASAKFIQLFDYAASQMPSNGLTEFPNCAANKSMGLDFKHIMDITEAYKLYLQNRWKSDAFFKNARKFKKNMVESK